MKEDMMSLSASANRDLPPKKKMVAKSKKANPQEEAFGKEAPVAQKKGGFMKEAPLTKQHEPSIPQAEKKAVVSKAKKEKEPSKLALGSIGTEPSKVRRAQQTIAKGKKAMPAEHHKGEEMEAEAKERPAMRMQMRSKAMPRKKEMMAKDLPSVSGSETEEEALGPPMVEMQQMVPNIAEGEVMMGDKFLGEEQAWFPEQSSDLETIGATRFQVLRDQKLGSGGFGTVFKAFDTHQGTHVAVKETDIGPTTGAALESLKSEFALLTELRHPNVVSVLDLTFDEKEGVAQIFMEWMSSGSVKSIIDQTGFRLHENVIRRYTAAALEGLAYLHGKNVLHRDVKPANMLVSGDGIIKLSDFGTSKATQTQTATTTQHVVGTCAYMAPESIQRGKYSTASDMWALGCSIVEMATGRPPWDELPEEQKAPIPMMFYIGTAQPPNHHPHIPTHLSKELQDIAARCFAYDPKDRGNAGELQQLGYFTNTTLPEGAESPKAYQQAFREMMQAKGIRGSSFEGASGSAMMYGMSSEEPSASMYEGQGSTMTLSSQEPMKLNISYNEKDN